MPSPAVTFTLVYVVAVAFLGAGSVYYAVRLSKVTGIFRGWTLIIISSVLVLVQGTAGFVELIVLLPEKNIDLVFQLAREPLFTFASVSIILSFTLLVAMLDLYRTFAKVRNNRS